MCVMDIILEVLREMNFNLSEILKVDCNYDESKENMFLQVDLMISEEYVSQAYLIVDCDNSQLINFVDGRIIKEIALAFRKSKFHKAEMDRNTTLLIISKREAEEDTSSKVKIEDDPYYFKKYVFVYDELGYKNAKEWLQVNGGRGSKVQLIQDYVSDIDYFTAYKNDCHNENIYRFFIELVTKIHSFPIKTAETKNIKSVRDFLNNNLEDLRHDEKKPIEIDLGKMECFIGTNVDYDNVEDICQKWNSIFEGGMQN